MCGIAGYFGAGNEQVLRRMTEKIHHRGPDDDGYYFGDNVGFGFRRLSIIDVAGGHQPISNEDQTVWAMLNGEIYNFQKHREDLIVRGHIFKTKSDTEVIVHLYEEYGERVGKYLQGMFAIAIWDVRARRLLLLRDRLGKKPLYYTTIPGGVAFGSELKAVLAHPSVSRDIDPLSVALFLSYEFVPTPLSIFSHINKLAPATVRIYDAAGVREHVFWKPESQLAVPPSFDDAIEQADHLISSAVRERLVADVPLGIFLSGGIDSTLIAAYAAQHSATSLKTFTIGFDDPSYDERVVARRTAARLGAEHHEAQFREEDLLTLIPQLAQHMDEPLADPSLLPTTLLSRFAREHVTVALGGDGGDELFSGYPTMFTHAIAEKYPLALFAPAARIIGNIIPISDAYMSVAFSWQRFWRGIGSPLLERDLLWRGAFAPSTVQKMMPTSMHAAATRARVHTAVHAWDDSLQPYTQRLFIEYLRHFMMDEVLVKVDRASMSAGIEVRAPLLATSLVEFAAGLPENWKRHGLTGKVLIRELMAQKFPGLHQPGKKHGFSIPVAGWLRGVLYDDMREAIRTLETRGLIVSGSADQYVRDHRDRRRDYRKELWSLYTLGKWAQHWL